jgi:hypothetical protein
VEGAAKVGTAEVGAAKLGGGGVGGEHGVDAGADEVALQVPGLEASEEELDVERGVDGVAGLGVVELEAEVLADRDGRAGAAQRDASGGRRGSRERRGGRGVGAGASGWGGVWHWCRV